MKLLGTNKILECQTVLKKLEACCRSQWICTYSSPVYVFPAKALYVEIMRCLFPKYLIMLLP